MQQTINPRLVLPGNYERILFTLKNEPHIPHILQLEEQKQTLSNLLTF